MALHQFARRIFHPGVSKYFRLPYNTNPTKTIKSIKFKCFHSTFSIMCSLIRFIDYNYFIKLINFSNPKLTGCSTFLLVLVILFSAFSQSPIPLFFFLHKSNNAGQQSYGVKQPNQKSKHIFHTQDLIKHEVYWKNKNWLLTSEQQKNV